MNGAGGASHLMAYPSLESANLPPTQEVALAARLAGWWRAKLSRAVVELRASQNSLQKDTSALGSLSERASALASDHVALGSALVLVTRFPQPPQLLSACHYHRASSTLGLSPLNTPPSCCSRNARSGAVTAPLAPILHARQEPWQSRGETPRISAPTYSLAAPLLFLILSPSRGGCVAGRQATKPCGEVARPWRDQGTGKKSTSTNDVAASTLPITVTTSVETTKEK